jgi:ketosteroid isomerase-like protein
MYERQADIQARRPMMKADAKTEAAVLETMNKWLTTYRNRDINGLMSTLSADDDIFLFGTGIDEKRIGREEFKFQAERDWEQMDELNFDLTWYTISAEGPVAWMAADATGSGTAGGQQIEFPLRFTGVFKQEGGDEWRLIQSHVSLPAGGQEEGNSVPV